MGAHMSLLLASIDKRITDVLAIVPPFIEGEGLTDISPMALVSRLTNNRLMLITAGADQYSTPQQNIQRFAAISSPNKRRAVVAGGHILPEVYLQQLKHWFVQHQLEQ